MRIYSKFRDYYDIGLQYGIDPNCKYVRDKKVLYPVDKEYKEVIDKILHYTGELPEVSNTIRSYNVILFCDRIYFCLEPIDGSCISTFIYTYENLCKYIIKYNKSHKNDNRFNKLINTTRHNFGRRNVRDYFDNIPMKMPDALTNLLIDYGTPVIRYVVDAYNEKKVEINPVLQDIQFFKAVDPVTAFQNISMFISGVMGGVAPPMIQISDIIRLEKHGFDKVKSFRNMK